MKWLDYPPIWLLACVVLSWYLADVAPGLQFGAWAWSAGAVLIGAGILCMIFAVLEFNKARTTVIPHRAPSTLISGGIYRYSRNPIYLGDLLVLAGLILRWDAVLALPLIPLLAWILTVRFIKPEEARLEDAFPVAYPEYKDATRRWI